MANTTTPPQATPALKARFDRFELDEAEARLLVDGEPVRLSPKPFAVLCALARSPQRLVTKSALLDQVWGHQYVSESVLKTTISDVRAALQDDAKQPRYIETVSCRGYRFIGTPASPVAHHAAPAPVQAPARPAAPPPAAPVGSSRTRALERLRDAWQQAGNGARQVVWVAGEAGVGKTTLIDRFEHELGAVSCAHGQCVAHRGEAEPHLPILEALAGLCRRDPSLVQLMREVAPSWLWQLPWLCSAAERDLLRPEATEAGRTRMLREMAELLDRYSAERPLLLVTEDLQWADEGTVQLLDYIARRRSTGRLMWLSSFRLTEVIAAERPLSTVRQELRLHGLGQEIVLDAFSQDEVAEFATARVPALAAQPALLHALYERTDGLPLFVAAVVDRLAASDGREGAPAGSMLQQVQGIAVPDTLAGIVERYLDELTSKQCALLEAASVCGTHFQLSTLADVVQDDLAPVAAACADLARRQRWLGDAADAPGSAPEETYVFRHALYREVLYQRLDRTARSELHRRLRASLDRRRAETKATIDGAAMAHASSRSRYREPGWREALPMPA